MRRLASIPLALSLAVTPLLTVPPAALAQQQLPATGVPSGPGGADPALFRSPPLDPVSFVMAYHRLVGTTVDWRPFAERSAAYRNATTFDRPGVLTREIARLEGQFASLDLNRVYVMRLGTRLRQYDSARGGFPVGVDPESFVRIQDPVTFQAYGLQFRNLEEVSLVPIPDTTAARNFAQRHGFNLQYNDAGDVVLEMAFRLAEAPPDVGGGTTIVRADIVAARLATSGNQPVWAFAPTAAGRSAPTTAAAPGTVPVLKAADIQGIRVGMPIAEARGIASREYAIANPLREAGMGGRHFRAEEDRRASRDGRCGLDPLSPQEAATLSMQSAMQGGDINPATPIAEVVQGCVSYETAFATDRTPTGRVGRVTSGQRLGGSADGIRTALREKYGTPTYTRNDGATLQWIGRDPARPDGPAVSVTAQIDARQGGGALLGIEVKEWVDPRLRSAPAPAATGPRL